MEERILTLHCSGTDPDAPLSGAAKGDQFIELWWATLQDLAAHRERLERLLDPVEQQRAQRFRFAHDRERFVLGHGALRHVIGSALGEKAGALRFMRGPFGKPSIDGPPVHFNFSDTKDAILIGLCNEHDIGVDIETMARDVDHHAVSEHYFTSEEVEAIRKDGDGSKRKFLEYWTRKEAVLKASGVGIMDDLRVLCVLDGTHTMTISHEAFLSLAAAQYHVRTIHLGSDHIISLATSSLIAQVQLRRIEL